MLKKAAYDFALGARQIPQNHRRLKAPVRGLNSRTSLDMIVTRVETQAVMDLVGRLENGVGV